jgi:lipoyl(octanoyl) transferase
MDHTQTVKIKHWGLIEYHSLWQKMQHFTRTRTLESPDEWWLAEHFSVFTQGQAGKPEHVLDAGDIPVIKTDRGGQVTYHGPGQLILYLLCDLKRKAIPLKGLVNAIESAIIALLAEYQVTGRQDHTAPGVYVKDAKIASLGLRVHRGCSYHGLSLNVAMDLEPFTRINPCGYPNRKIVQLSDFCPELQVLDVAPRLIQQLSRTLNYTTLIEASEKDHTHHDVV